VIPVYRSPVEKGASLGDKVNRLAALRAYEGYTMLAEALERSRGLLPAAAEAFAAKHPTAYDVYYSEGLSVTSFAKFSLQMQGPMAVLHDVTLWAKGMCHVLAFDGVLPLELRVRLALADFYQQHGTYPEALSELDKLPGLSKGLNPDVLALFSYEKRTGADYVLELIPEDDALADAYTREVLRNALGG
jgi:hypothetical protein